MHQMTTITLTQETIEKINGHKDFLQQERLERCSFTDAIVDKIRKYESADYEKLEEIELPKGRINKCIYFRHEKDIKLLSESKRDMSNSEFIERLWRFENGNI